MFSTAFYERVSVRYILTRDFRTRRYERIMCLKINSVIVQHAPRAAGDIVLIMVKGLINFLPKFN